VGLTDTNLKSRFANHKQSFRNEVHSNQTELSKHVQQLKKAKVDYTIEWKILDRAQPYSNATRFTLYGNESLPPLTKEQSLRALAGMQTNSF